MRTPRTTKKSIKELCLSEIPEWTLEEIEQGFLLIRDFKHLTCSNIVGKKRAIPWLYVQNGCFLRAALSRRLLEEKGFPKIKKLFVFGDFKYETKWTKTGLITFKDHVGVAVRFKQTVYILDPSVNYNKPLKLDDWINTLTSCSSTKDVESSLCSDLTVGHNSNCDEELIANEVGIRKGITYTLDFFAMEFLAKEFENLVRLKMDLKKYLR